MTSQIDPDVFPDGERVSKPAVRETLQIAKDEITELQNRTSPVRVMAFGDDPFVEPEILSAALLKASNLIDLQSYQEAAQNTGFSFTVEDLAELKALTSRPESVLVKTGQAAGVWQWVAGSSTAADDALVVQCTSGAAGRYKRVFHGPVFVEWFGALGYLLSSDDSAAFTAALASGYPVSCRSTAYYVKDLTISGGFFDGQSAQFRAAAGAKWIFRLTGYGTVFKEWQLDDTAGAVVRSTTLNGAVLAAATSFVVTSATDLEIGMLATVLMDNGRWHVSPITNVVGTTITVARAFDAAATSGLEVACSWGMLNVRAATRLNLGPGSMTNVSFGIVSDIDPAAALGVYNNHMEWNAIRLEDVRHVGVFSGRHCADSDYSKIVLRGGVVINDNHVGDGVTDTFALSKAAWRKIDVSVYVDGVYKTLGTHYNFVSTTSIEFTGGNIPTAGQAIAIYNFYDGKAGLVVDATGWTIIRGGDTYHLIDSLDFVQCVEVTNKELSEFNQVIADSCSGEGVTIRACTGAGPISFGDLFAGYCHIPIKVIGSSTLFTTEGPLWLDRPSTADIISGVVGSYDIESTSGSTSYINVGELHPLCDFVTGGAGSLVLLNSKTFEFSTATALTAGTTSYAGSDGTGTSASSAWLLAKAQRIKRLLVYSNNTPGAGQTYTVTLRSNFTTDSAIFTGQIVNGSFAIDLKGLESFVAGTSIQVKIVLSGSATSAAFRGYIELVP